MNLEEPLFEGVKNSMNLLNKAICIAEEIASVRLQACFAKGCAYFYRASFRLQLQTWEEAHADASKAFEEFIKYSQLDSVHDLTLSACALLIKIESLECLGRYEQALELFGQLQMMQETLTWHYPDQHTVHLSRSFEVNARLHMALNRFEEAGASAFHALSRCQIWTGEKSLFIQGQEVSSARTFSRAAYYLGKKDLWQQYEHKANLLYAELEGKGLRMFPLPAMLPLTR